MSFSAAAGNVAPTVIHTDAQGLVHGDFQLPVADGSISAYYAAPEGKRDLPVVLVVQEIFELILDIRDAGTTVLLIEQNAGLALQIADRGYVLENGSISLSGTGEDLLHDENVIKAYLGM